MRRNKRTAGDFVARLRDTPQGTQRSNVAAEARSAAFRQAERKILRELQASGVDVHRLEMEYLGVKIQGLDYFVNTKNPYPEAIPVLLKHLRMEYSKDIKECLVRALTVKEARGTATEALLEEFGKHPSTGTRIGGLKWACGNALSVVATADAISQLAELVQDKSQGWERVAIAQTLSRFCRHDRRARTALEKVRDDPEVGEAASRALSKCGFL
jgi:hypothetical protein